VLTRWQPQRVSSRRIEAALIAADLPPAARIRARSAAIARAAERRIPLAVSNPDSAIALAYRELAGELTGVSVR